MRFAPGNKYGKSQTPHPGPGQKPNWFKKKCASILQDKRLFDFLGDVASGEKVERFITADGKKVYKIPARIAERLKAICELRDTAYGRPSQHVDVTNSRELMELLSFVSLLIKQHVPAGCPHCKKKLGVVEILSREFGAIAQKYMIKKGEDENPPVA